MDDPDLFAHQTLTEKYLKNFNIFLENYSEQVIKLLGDSINRSPIGVEQPKLTVPSHLEPNEVQPASLITTNVESFSSNPIEIAWGPLEELLTLEEIVISPASFAPNTSINGYDCHSTTLVTSDVQKVMLVLVSLTNQLKEQYRYGCESFLYQLMLYGDIFDNANTSPNGHSSVELPCTTEGDGHVALSKFIAVLYQLEEFAIVAHQLLSHIIQQLGSLFKDSKPHVVAITGLHLSSLFQEISSFLSLFIILDEVIANQPTLQQHWLKYKRMIKSVRADTNTFGIDSSKLNELERNLIKLDKSVMSARLFCHIIEKVQGEWKGSRRHNSSRNSTLLIEQFTHELTRMSLTLDKDFHEGGEALKPISFTAMYLLAAALFAPTFDSKKIFTRLIWENLKRIPAVPIGGTYLWIPETFLNSFQKQLQQLHSSHQHHRSTTASLSSLTNQLITNKLLRSQMSARESYLDNRMSNLQKDVANIQYQVLQWTFQLQQIFYSSYSRSQLNLQDLISRCNLLIHGTKLAQTVNMSFKILINLHVILGKSISIQLVGYLSQYMELLKLILCTFSQYNKQICQTIMIILQTVLHIALTQIHSVSESLSSVNGTPSYNGNGNINLERDEIRKDGLVVIKILEYVLKGSPTQERLLVAKIALDWALLSFKYWKDNEQKVTIEAALERILTVSELQDKIQSLCNCCDIYWHRILMNSYLSYLYRNEQESSKLPLISLIFQDCIRMLKDKCENNYHREEVVKKFIAEIEEYAQTQIVEKVCQDIETDLRFQSHSHLQQQQHSLLKVNETSPFHKEIKDYKIFLDIPAITLDDKRIYIKDIVEDYLSRNFYNLASVALHDWQSYATMRVLAMQKYNLRVLQDHLPGHSLEQGLDILAIVRNLNKFVTEFSYNLNNQVFIQMYSLNKHLDTVNIRHLANSMRTHGPGMSNTTVNFTYQFLRTKIHIFSQFLYDEQIKSRLSKDIRIFKQGRQNLDAASSSSIASYSFPYDRALKFQRGIRKIGLTAEGMSPLDQFRVLITHIGNALGFVRLVRSGCLHFLAAGSRFVADLDEVTQFSEFQDLLGKNITNNELQEELKKSSDCLTKIVGTLATGSTVDYFSLLAKAFASPCRSDSNIHLRNFFVIIPALTLSYVDHMRGCKEKLSKKTKGISLFTDDGFPMGIAYLLKVLGQDAEFDSLQWFAGVSKKLHEERKVALQTIKESKADEKLQQANSLTAKRLQDILQEFHLLRYNLSSARIFFQKSEPALTTKPALLTS